MKIMSDTTPGFYLEGKGTWVWSPPSQTERFPRKIKLCRLWGFLLPIPFENSMIFSVQIALSNS
jgi:hypothetical protein